ncbi:hypothetical protein MP228_012922 [Amoeboaphelidium protococcarum]|nr:hypothetical protein MP228_012922 [Amoeboaphelidium protococcarum]
MGNALFKQKAEQKDVIVTLSGQLRDALEIDQLGDLSVIDKLFLSNNRLESLPQELIQCLVLRELSLSSNRFVTIPSVVFQLPHLTKLSLSNNQLRRVPPEIQYLQQLRLLALAGNQIEELPQEIGELSNLIALDLQRNQLSSLPESIGNLRSLETFMVSQNQLTRLPDSIGQLISLQILNVSKNSLVTLPSSLKWCSELCELIFFKNNIQSLPADLFQQMVKLQILDMHANCLQSIPASIGNLKKVWRINCAMNQIAELPQSIYRLRSLRWLNLNDNHLVNISSDIGQLYELTKFGLVQNRITELPQEIGLLGSLTKLDIRRNPISLLPSNILSLNLNCLVMDDIQFEERATGLLNHPQTIPPLQELCLRALSELDGNNLHPADNIRNENHHSSVCQLCLQKMFDYKLEVVETHYIQQTSRHFSVKYEFCSYNCLDMFKRQRVWMPLQLQQVKNYDDETDCDQALSVSLSSSTQSWLQCPQRDTASNLDARMRFQILKDAISRHSHCPSDKRLYAWQMYIQARFNQKMCTFNDEWLIKADHTQTSDDYLSE